MAISSVLIDTNVCLDAAKKRKPYAKAATEIIFRSEQKEYQGLIAAHSLDTIFYFLEKEHDRGRAYEGLKGLRKAIHVAPVTQSVIDQALEIRWHDFEDAIHYAAAQAAGCDAIITRNKRDFKQSDLPVLSPVEFLDRLDQQ